MKHLGFFPMLIVVCILSYWAYERNMAWQTKIDLWLDCVKKSPEKERPYSNLAAALIENNQFEEAIEVSKVALSKDDKQYYIYYNMGIAYEKLDRLDEAYAVAHKAVLMEKSNVTLWQLGVILKRMGYRTDGKAIFKEGQR